MRLKRVWGNRRDDCVFQMLFPFVLPLRLVNAAWAFPIYPPEESRRGRSLLSRVAYGFGFCSGLAKRLIWYFPSPGYHDTLGLTAYQRHEA
ncbi:hypothetical protein VTH06DRAFT_8641 [Thermothelomyces fergusii]